MSTTSTGRRWTPPATRSWGVALALLTAVVSGLAIFVNGRGVARFDDATVYTTAKNLVAAVLLAGASLAYRRPELTTAPTAARSHRAGLVLVGVIGGGIPFVLFFEGLARASSAPAAAFIHKTLIVWVALLAVPLLKERFSTPHACAVVLLVAGQAVLVDDWAFDAGAGALMILAATLLWAVEVVVARRLLATVPAADLAVARMSIGGLVLVAFLTVTGRIGDLAGLTASQWAWAAMTGAILAVYVGGWYAALARAQAVDVTAVLVLGAVITAVLSAGIDGLALAPDVPGLALIVAGVAVVAGLAVRRPPPVATPTTVRVRR